MLLLPGAVDCGEGVGEGKGGAVKGEARRLGRGGGWIVRVMLGLQNSFDVICVVKVSEGG